MTESAFPEALAHLDVVLLDLRDTVVCLRTEVRAPHLAAVTRNSIQSLAAEAETYGVAVRVSRNALLARAPAGGMPALPGDFRERLTTTRDGISGAVAERAGRMLDALTAVIGDLEHTLTEVTMLGGPRGLRAGERTAPASTREPVVITRPTSARSYNG